MNRKGSGSPKYWDCWPSPEKRSGTRRELRRRSPQPTLRRKLCGAVVQLEEGHLWPMAWNGRYATNILHSATTSTKFGNAGGLRQEAHRGLKLNDAGPEYGWTPLEHYEHLKVDDYVEVSARKNHTTIVSRAGWFQYLAQGIQSALLTHARACGYWQRRCFGGCCRELQSR